MKLTADQITALKNVIEIYYDYEKQRYQTQKNVPIRHIFDDLFILKQALKEQSYATNIK